MSEPSAADKILLTIPLSAEVAGRLKLAAETRKRSAVEVVAELLERHLPRPRTGPAKNKIPYT